LSGAKSFDIVKGIFRANVKFAEISPRSAILGTIADGNEEIDEVILIKFAQGNSYTNEDMVEINCHGGIYVSSNILDLVLCHGARMAQPGEFTLRAFLNGRIDLARAEAIADLIQAQTRLSQQAAVKQLKGILSTKIYQIRDELIEAVSLLEAELDFSEEDLELVKRDDLLQDVQKAEEHLTDLIATYRIGRIARDGVKLVIIGKPNVGKSSLLNFLAQEERAIVTNIPGTTRDSIEVQLDIQGILFRMVDTAGIKFSEDPIEKEGMRKAEQHLQLADIIVHVFDGSTKVDQDDLKVVNKIASIPKAKVVRVINKADLKQAMKASDIGSDGGGTLSISALTGKGIDQLIAKIVGALNEDGWSEFQQAVVTNARHFNSLKNALVSIVKAKNEIKKGASPEFISLFLRDTLDYLGQIIGAVTSEEILNNIFSKFCIGK
jgi:tRNA modification GTPase